MVSYLKIRSVSQTNPVDMFTLGVSTARGVEGKIGKFGSGSLMGSLLWIRSTGGSPIFYLNGVRVHFESRPETTTTGGIFHRVYQVVDGVETPLSVALEYGESDWVDETMALREFICNSLDQGTLIHDSVSQVNSLDCSPDEVCVFVPMTASVREYWKHIGDYFLHYTFRQDCKYIQKSETSPCKVYRRGVLIKELERETRFDYNLDIPVSENRNDSTDSLNDAIDNFVDGSDRGADSTYCEILFRMICAGVDCHEVKVPRSYLYGAWKDFLRSPAVKGVKLQRERSKLTGTGYVVDNAWYSTLVHTNVELSGYEDTYAEENAIRWYPADSDTELEVQQAWDFLESLRPGDPDKKKTCPTVFCFVNCDGTVPDSMSKYDRNTNRLFVFAEAPDKEKAVLEGMIPAHCGSTSSWSQLPYLVGCLLTAKRSPGQ